MLYHATFIYYLSSIREKGLGAVQVKNWDFSEDVTVYLRTDPDEAISFCEAAESVPDEVYDSGIVLLGIPQSALLLSLKADKNIANTKTCFEYHGIISPENISVLETIPT